MSESWLNPEWRPGPNETVVCVHGALVHGWEMFLLRQRLRQAGYRVQQFGYMSMLRGLEDNTERLRSFIRKTEGEVIHVVGHSMGGVLTRRAFEQQPDPRPGRLIAIGSPFLDCWTARRALRLNPVAGQLLIGRTVQDHIHAPVDPVWRGTRDFGVIAGTYRFGVGAVFPSHPLESDGVILLEETRLQGVRARVEYRLNHFGMLYSRRCCEQVARFLATGEFGPVANSAGRE